MLHSCTQYETNDKLTVKTLYNKLLFWPKVLTLILKRNIADDGLFQYHVSCRDLGIVNLCFADDLMMFCHGDLDFVKTIKKIDR